MPERESKRLGSDTPLWSFWLLNGGYTSEYYLKSIANGNGTTSQPAMSGKRKSTLDNTGGETRAPKKRKGGPPWQCFDVSSIEHQNAANLDHIGVWLGDYISDNVPVNGISWTEVQEQYFDQTLGGMNCAGAEPHTLDHFSHAKYAARCAACFEDPGPSPQRSQREARKLEIEMIGMKVNKDEAEMKKNVSCSS